MVDSLDEFFYDTIIDTSSDESDDDTEILVVVTLLVHDQGNHVQKYMGSVKGRIVAKPRNQEAGHEQLWWDYFH
jgi:hypothetical protein